MKGKGPSRSRAPGRREIAAALAHRWLPWAALLLFVVAGAYRFDPKPSVSGDNAQFLILGESIATGHGMSQINEPDPSPNTKYPFFFPLLLAGLYRIAPGSILVPKLFVFLLGGASVVLLARIYLRLAPPPVAAAAAVMTALNPTLLEFSHQVLSEIPYLFLTALSLTFFLDWEDAKGRRSFALAFAAALAAYFTRSAGIALVGAFVLLLAGRRRFRSALIVGLVFLAAATPWALRNRAVGGGESYLHQFFMKNPYRAEEGPLTLRHFVVNRVWGNIAKYGTFEAGRGLVPSPFTGLLPSEAGWRAWLSAAACLIALAGLVAALVRRAGLVEIYAVLSVGICIAWPEVWMSIRFLLPVLPFLIFYGLRGMSAAFGRLSPRGAGPVFAAIALVLVVSNGKANIDEKRLYGGDYPAVWRNYFAVADWVRKNTPEDSVVICRKPYLFYLRSHRQTSPYLWSNEPSEVLAKMEKDGADYVVIAPLSATTARYLIPTIQAYPDDFEVILQYENPDTWLLRMKGEEER